MKQSEVQQFTSWLGKRSYKARLEWNGLAWSGFSRSRGRTARRAGRPKGSGKQQTKKGGK
jgi:hypothetical protein